MKTYIFYLGLTTQDGDTIPVEKAIDKIGRLLKTHHLDGATITEGAGLWMGEREGSLAVSVFDTRMQSPSARESLAQDLCYIFNQECVAVQAAPPLEFIPHPDTAPQPNTDQ